MFVLSQLSFPRRTRAEKKVMIHWRQVEGLIKIRLQIQILKK